MLKTCALYLSIFALILATYFVLTDRYDSKKTWQHNKVVYVHTHHCTKRRLYETDKTFDAVSNSETINYGADAYNCDGVYVYIHDDEEQP
jgi:hypothetical protein